MKVSSITLALLVLLSRLSPISLLINAHLLAMTYELGQSRALPILGAMSQVNLDALIPREDLFKISDDDQLAQIIPPDFRSVRIDSDLKPSQWFYKTLRKADFQRVTSEWKPERIAGLIRSFVNGDIIPAVILWSWKSNNFIIDGGHRLSAIVAWILNDYGDGSTSKNYFGEENISTAQKKNAAKTRKLIDDSTDIGAFATYEYALANPEKVSNEQLQRANILSNRAIQIQWINANTSKDAEASFFRINGEATPIDETEALILKSREKPNAISSRAIMHSGSAHKYWSKFPNQKQLEGIATKINRLLFAPELEPKGNRFPIGGRPYSRQTLDLVFGIVNMVNGLEELNFNRKTLLKEDADKIKPPKDEDGKATLDYLNRVERIVAIIAGKDGYSLGLSPLIYFYSLRGRFQITSFLAIVSIMIQYDKERKRSQVFQRFSAIRGKLEDFLLKYKSFVTQATTNVGSGFKSYKRLADLFLFIIDSFLERKSSDKIIELIQQDARFGFVRVFEAENRDAMQRNPPGKKLPKETAVEVVVNAYLKARILCPICGGHATFESYNIEHLKTLNDGGRSNIENLQMAHYYCNEEEKAIKELRGNLENSR